MTTAHSSNSRASLLSGLRTGGVRSTSASIPHTAAPGGSFNVPRFASNNYSVFPEEEENDQVLEIPSQNAFANFGARQHPITAAVDGPNNRFSQHQQRGLNPNSVPFSPGFNPIVAQQNHAQAQAQAFQLQMMQLELLKMQAAQQAQYQAELIAQAQRQQQSQAQNRRASAGYTTPATAGPASNTFDLRSATLSAQMRKANQPEQSGNLPMTAALGGKFGARAVSGSPVGPGMQKYTESNEPAPLPSTPGSTTVISGGTSLGNIASNNAPTTPVAASKSDSVSSWRRGGRNNSVLSGMNRSVTSPSVRVTPPPAERVSPPPASPVVASPTTKFRPQPLQFSAAVSKPLPVVAVADSGDSNDNDDDCSSVSSKSGSSPTTPQSSSSNEMPMSPREEATKKLYEGLGIGRPKSSTGMAIPSVTVNNDDGTGYSLTLPQSVMVSHRMVSQPTRQPRGPPSGADELGPKNFATRIRRKAIGGLGALMGARERREFIEAY